MMSLFFFNDTATTEIYTLSLHDALPILKPPDAAISLTATSGPVTSVWPSAIPTLLRSEEHTSELQSQSNLVCRLLLEKKKKTTCRTGVDWQHSSWRLLRATHVVRLCSRS